MRDFSSRFEAVVRDWRMLKIEPEDEDLAKQSIHALANPNQDHATVKT
jgi:hypothetical protein